MGPRYLDNYDGEPPEELRQGRVGDFPYEYYQPIGKADSGGDIVTQIDGNSTPEETIPDKKTWTAMEEADPEIAVEVQPMTNVSLEVESVESVRLMEKFDVSAKLATQLETMNDPNWADSERYILRYKLWQQALKATAEEVQAVFDLDGTSDLEMALFSSRSKELRLLLEDAASLLEKPAVITESILLAEFIQTELPRLRAEVVITGRDDDKENLQIVECYYATLQLLDSNLKLDASAQTTLVLVLAERERLCDEAKREAEHNHLVSQMYVQKFRQLLSNATTNRDQS